MQNNKELKKFIEELIKKGYTEIEIINAARSIVAKHTLKKIETKGIFK